MNADWIEQRRVIQAHGGRFDGSTWMLLMETSAPLEEAVLVVACPPAVVHSSVGRPTGLHAALYETRHGPVLHLVLRLFDRPAEPLMIDLLVNPAPGAAWEMLHRLSGQRTLQLLFHDASSGRPLRRRILQLAPQLCAALEQVCARTRTVTTNPDRWQRAVQAVDHLRL